MKYSVPQKITEISRILRRNMTGAEKILWKELRSKKLGVKFLRQHPIYVCTEDSGQYRFVIADFYCDEYRLIIEIDGGVHSIPDVENLDRYKENLLFTLGYSVIRFSNIEIIQDITLLLKKIQNHCSPSP